MDEPFDPVAAGAVAVDEPFDPTKHGAIPVEPKHEGGIISGIVAGLGRALNPINLVKGALDIGHPSDISNIIHYGKTLGEIVTGTPPDEAIGRNIPELQQQREAVYGKLGAKEQATALTGIGLQLGMTALPFLHGETLPRAPGSLAEVAGIAKPEAAPESGAAATEPIITPPNEPTGISQPQIEPSGLYTEGQNLEAQFAEAQRQAADLQERINAQRAAQPVPAAESVATAPLSTETIPTPEEVIPNATEERKIQSNIPAERTGDGTSGTPAEASGSGGVQPEAEVQPVAPQEQVAELPLGEQGPVSATGAAGTGEVIPGWFHGSHELLNDLSPREVKSVDSLGTWLTNKPEYAKQLYGPNVTKSELPTNFNLLEFDGSDLSTRDFNRVLGANAQLAKEAGFPKESAILDKTLPDSQRLSDLTKKLNSDEGLTPKEHIERRTLQKSEDASRTLLGSQKYNQLFRQMLRDQGYDGIVWKNSFIDIPASGAPHDVAVIFHEKPIKTVSEGSTGTAEQISKTKEGTTGVGATIAENQPELSVGGAQGGRGSVVSGTEIPTQRGRIRSGQTELPETPDSTTVKTSTQANPASSIIPEGKVDFDILDHPDLGLTPPPKGVERIPRGSLPEGTIYKSVGEGSHGNRPPTYAFTPDGRVYSDSNRMMTHGGMSPFVLEYVTKWYKEPSPVSEPTETTTAQPLPQETAPAVPPTEPPPTPAETAEATGISNKRFTEAYGDSAPVATTGKGPEAWHNEGMSRLDNYQKTGDVKDDPYSVLSSRQQDKPTGNSLASDVALLGAEHERLLQDARNAEGTPEYQDKSQAALNMGEAIKGIAHGPASDVFRALQDHNKPRYDNVTDFDQALRERENRESTLAEKDAFRKMSKDVASTRDAATKEINGAQAKLNKFPRMNFDEAMTNIHDQISELTKNCVL